MLDIKHEIIEYCGDESEGQDIFIDEIFDDCLIGHASVGSYDIIPAYDFDKVLKVIRETRQLNDEQTIEYFNTKVLDAGPDVAFIKLTDKPETHYDFNGGMLTMDEFDRALVGFKIQKNRNMVTVYEQNKCIDILMENMDEEDAQEYFSYNVSGSYVGENTPAILNLLV